jgi:hypothetical protein
MKSISFVSVVGAVAFALSSYAAGPSPADVGDADSFGHNAQYMGAASGFVVLSNDCTGLDNPPDQRCFVLDPMPGALTTFTADNICRIKLPKKATKTLIYPVLTFFENHQLRNTTGATVPNALFDYSATLSIESSVLLDPSIIDPNTGLPANGTLIFVFAPNRVVEDRTMADGERSRKRITFTRAGNAGISKANLIAGGLTAAQADDLFKSAITVHFNVTGRARYVTDASITGNMRLFGD